MFHHVRDEAQMLRKLPISSLDDNDSYALPLSKFTRTMTIWAELWLFGPYSKG